MHKKLFLYGSIVMILVLVVVAFVYWLVPAGSLPTYFPGFESGSAHIHFKHGVASFLLACALGAYAWFNSGTQLK